MDAFILSHQSALQAIRYARSRYFGLPWDGLTRPQQQRALEACAPAGGDIDYGALERVGAWDPELRDPVDVLVGGAGARRRHLDLAPHVMSGTLPSNSLLQVQPGLYCCSPALVITQYAQTHPWQEVLALCMELCGAFGLGDEGYLVCEPALTVVQLNRYLGCSKQIRGLPVARKAARYALNGAASPMEGIVGALYHVPLSLGGFGLDSMLLNHRIDFDHDAVLASGMPYAICDAYLPLAKTTFEYNGGYHDAASARRHDEKRTAGLLAMGIQTIPLNDGQLRDIEALEAIAKTVYKRIGKRLRYTTAGYRPKQLELLNALRTSMGLRAC